MNKGKVVLVPFPFDDLSSTKVRPAVCLTEPMDIYGHIILVQDGGNFQATRSGASGHAFPSSCLGMHSSKLCFECSWPGNFRHPALGFITSRISNHVLETDIVLDSTHVDFPATGLHVSSILKLNRLLTVRKTLILRQLGQLSPTLQLQVDQKLRQLFGLNH